VTTTETIAAQFNQPLDPSLFTVTTPAQATVTDNRTPPDPQITPTR